MFVGLLDLASGELLFSNAGHEPPVFISGGARLTLPSTGAALGLFEDADYEEERTLLGPGSTLLLYTDGISESRRGQEFLGVEGIAKELLACGELGSEDLARCVHRAAIDFAGGELKDDAAILAVRATG